MIMTKAAINQDKTKKTIMASKRGKEYEFYLWSKERKYRFCINHHWKFWDLDDCITVKGDHRFFCCPKCLENHRVPARHGAILQCVCGAAWSFWGAGFPSPEEHTAKEIIDFLKRQGAQIGGYLY